MFRDARLRAPQRYGCDFFKADSAGQQLPNPFPDEITNSMFYGYGAEVPAVADGVVAHVTDGIPENVPQAKGPIKMSVPLTNETGSGNWISLRVGSAYVFYAHLQPGSITVREGQRVRRGQVIGRLGNSGNSVGPHLHFHVGDSNSLNGSEPVPHVFDSFLFGGRGEASSKALRRTLQLPLEDAMVDFGGGRQPPRVRP